MSFFLFKANPKILDASYNFDTTDAAARMWCSGQIATKLNRLQTTSVDDGKDTCNTKCWLDEVVIVVINRLRLYDHSGHNSFIMPDSYTERMLSYFNPWYQSEWITLADSADFFIADSTASIRHLLIYLFIYYRLQQRYIGCKPPVQTTEETHLIPKVD